MWILTFIGLLIVIPIGWLLLAGAISVGVRILLLLIYLAFYALGGVMIGGPIGLVLAELLRASGAPQSVCNGAIFLCSIGGASFVVFSALPDVWCKK